MEMHKISKYVNQDDNCLYCAIGNVLKWYGFDDNYVDLIFNTQLDFYYARQIDNNYNFRIVEDFIVNFIIDKEPLKQRLERLMKPFNINISWHESIDYEKSWNHICDLSKTKPIVLFVNHYYLPYHDAYMKSNGGHFLTMTGNNKDKDAYVIDSVKAYDFEGILTYEQLKCARNLKTNIFDINNAWILIDIPKDFDRNIKVETFYLLLDNICNNMMFKKSEDNNYWGIEAIKNFKYDLVNMANNFGKNEESYILKEGLEESFNNLFISILRIAQQRNTFSNQLKIIVESINIKYKERFLIISDIYKDIHKRWIMIRNKLFLAYKKKDKERLNNVINEISEIIILEEKAIKLLYGLKLKLINI